MAPVFAILILFGGIALFIGLIAVGAHVLDNRETAIKARKKRVKQLETALQQVDDIARDSLTVNPGDVTALQIASEINKVRRAL